ncbi:twin-arginine translocation pathway signal protein [Rhodopseudomonas sp. HC1]|nr:twin-arginine translocation pathway signal protein [Rhodopseudomonas infernalis]MCG6203171.1 twin-arginine translocation pathway signal protein [Rhodopseudomonas infernalis]
MQHLDIHSGQFGLTGRDILVSLAAAAVALILTPVIGLFLLLLTG